MDNEKTKGELPLLAPVKVVSKEELMKEYPNKETIEKAKEYWFVETSKYAWTRYDINPKWIPEQSKIHVIEICAYRSLERERDGLRALVEKANTLIYMVADRDMKIERWLKAKKELTSGQ